MSRTSSSGFRCGCASGAARRSIWSSDRSRENRSQFVFAKARGRDVIFWQSARTSRQARPNVAVPTARAAGLQLEIIVDSHERYPWTFQPPTGDDAAAGVASRRLRRRARRPDRRRSRAQVTRRSGVDDDERQDAVPAGRSCSRAERGGGRRGPLLGRVQARARPPSRGRQRPRRSGGPLPERADRVRRDPARSPKSGPTGSSAPPSPTTTTTHTPRRSPPICRPRARCQCASRRAPRPEHGPAKHGIAVADRGRLHPEVWGRLPRGSASRRSVLTAFVMSIDPREARWTTGAAAALLTTVDGIGTTMVVSRNTMSFALPESLREYIDARVPLGRVRQHERVPARSDPTRSARAGGSPLSRAHRRRARVRYGGRRRPRDKIAELRKLALPTGSWTPARLRPVAETDLVERTRYSSVEAGADVAERFFDTAISALRSVARMPGTGSPRAGDLYDVAGLRVRRMEGFLVRVVLLRPVGSPRRRTTPR